MIRKPWIVSMAWLTVQNVVSQNVGIGTTSPTARLDILAHSGFNAPLLKVGMDGTSSPYIIIQPDGKVGIGTANPSQTLDVAGNMQFAGALMPNGNPGTSGQVLVSQGPGNPPQWQAVGGTGGVAGLCASPSTNFIQKWTGSELCNSLIYDNGTNVGIGTNNPSRKLTVMDNTGSASGALYARQMVHNPSSWTIGAYIIGRGIAATNNSTSVAGLYTYGAWQPASGVTVNSNATGLYAISTNEGAGTLTYAYGIRSYVQLPSSGSGIITRGYAIYARCKDAQTCYGVYISGDPNNNQ
ncbi:MAG: hypothetical protein GXO48_07640, partial [Chlorobi bacterium]|nr:hypothetical protein [Chlorobiota bacterium]